MDKKKILVYAHYYYPDVASTAQIYQELFEGMSNTFDITIICTVPSYLGTIEEKYKVQRFYYENINGINLVRVRVPEFSKSNKKSRIMNIISYYFGARKATKTLGAFDYIFTLSQPPVLGGMLGVYGKKKKKAKLIYNIQDFNPEQVMATGFTKSKLIINSMMWLDKKSCINSDLVITVGKDLVETVYKRFTNKKGMISKKCPKTVMINNWINEEEIFPLDPGNSNVLEFKKKNGLENKFLIMYSGNMGLYYDLENILKVIERIKPGTKTNDGRDVAFVFVGAGTILNKLERYTKEHDMTNVFFLPYQPKEKLIYSLNAADVHLCVNAKGIKGVSCPSKYYGIAAVAKPIIGVLESGTEIRSIIEETNGGLVSNPGDYDGLLTNIKYFINNVEKISLYGSNSYTNLVKYLTKSISINKYVEEIEKL